MFLFSKSLCHHLLLLLVSVFVFVCIWIIVWIWIADIMGFQKIYGLRGPWGLTAVLQLISELRKNCCGAGGRIQMQSQRRLSRDATKNLGLKQSTENKKTIERVQKSAVAVILDSDYENSEHGLSVLALQCLHIRRKKLCTTFARRAAKHPQHSN